jgi:hypothetical protein
MKKRILKAVIKFGIIAVLSAGAISVALAGRNINHNQTLVRD